jgi:regulation of enolase protein 1 (concanavalin A-like superfamily)
MVRGSELDGACGQGPSLLARLDGNFQLSARTHVEGTTRFDAGAVVLYIDDTNWAKLCVERHDPTRLMVVSVVTRGVSDDCNSFVLEDGRLDLFLRASRVGDTFAFHASGDGVTWEMVRYFRLDPAADARVGLLAQSPRGERCRVTFSAVQVRSGP